jgi:hypothetical protein
VCISQLWADCYAYRVPIRLRLTVAKCTAAQELRRTASVKLNWKMVDGEAFERVLFDLLLEPPQYENFQRWGCRGRLHQRTRPPDRRADWRQCPGSAGSAALGPRRAVGEDSECHPSHARGACHRASSAVPANGSPPGRADQSGPASTVGGRVRVEGRPWTRIRPRRRLL